MANALADLKRSTDHPLRPFVVSGRSVWGEEIRPHRYRDLLTARRIARYLSRAGCHVIVEDVRVER